MSLFFFLNNFHFALEIFGALAFLMVAWLAFDAFKLRRDFLTLSRAFGFILLAIYNVMHALSLEGDFYLYGGYVLYIFGLLMVFLNLFLEQPVKRPEFKAILILPSAASISFYFEGAAAFFYFLITFLAFRQYQHEFKQMLKPFIAGFLLLSFGAIITPFYQDDFNAFWIIGHIFELLGSFMLVVWVWQYLQLRIREELILIFTSMALLISIVVTLAFSVILVNRIEDETKSNLSTDVKVMELALIRLREEALAKAKFLSGREDLTEAVTKNDLVKIEDLAEKYLSSEKLGFLTIIDANGDVILRAHSLTQKDDSQLSDTVVASALNGKDLVRIGFQAPEGFSVRAASPFKYGKKNIGAVLLGFPLDNAFADNLKRITGLEMSIFSGDRVVATTILNQDGRTRSVGIKETNKEVLEAVFNGGEEMSARVLFLSRPFLASYLPLKDEDGKIVGVLSSAKPQQEIQDIANATNRLTLLTVILLTLILILPIYFLTKRLSGEIT